MNPSKSPRSTRRTWLLGIVAAAAALAADGSIAQAYRVSNWSGANYQANSSLQVDVPGFPSVTYSTTQNFISDYQSNVGSTVSTIPAAINTTYQSPGDPLLSPSAVNASVYAKTEWGSNHVSVSMSGFDPYNPAPQVTTVCPTIPGSGSCIPGLPEQTQTLTTSNSAYVYGASRWEEIYQTGGASGTLGLTFSISAGLGDKPSGSGTPYGSSSFSWSERDFSGTALASVWAYYDTGSASWSMTTFSNTDGLYHYFGGTGVLKIGGGAPSLIATDGTSFDGSISVQRSYVTGDAVYVDSLAQATVEGNGYANAEHTVVLTRLDVPTGGRILASSGANYGGVVTFGGGSGSGTLCTDLSCLGGGTGGGGGGGGGTLPVPEPGTWALLLAGLGVVGRAMHRQRRQQATQSSY